MKPTLAVLKEAQRMIESEFPRGWAIHDEMEQAVDRVATLEGLLRECEWSGRIWTDVEVCPICFAAKDGLPAAGKDAKQEPLTHRHDCRLKEALGAGNGSAGSVDGLIAVADRTDAVRVDRTAEDDAANRRFGAFHLSDPKK